ncbi:hypothetical protein B484DRAFT_460905 [Ochromonadaceae sp. CCMP2298]|nr:hypothetical protein B484DRAFT_460905 [Ochromonadaceae sp. CCMP2298]
MLHPSGPYSDSAPPGSGLDAKAGAEAGEGAGTTGVFLGAGFRLHLLADTESMPYVGTLVDRTVGTAGTDAADPTVNPSPASPASPTLRPSTRPPYPPARPMAVWTRTPPTPPPRYRHPHSLPPSPQGLRSWIARRPWGTGVCAATGAAAGQGLWWATAIRQVRRRMLWIWRWARRRRDSRWRGGARVRGPGRVGGAGTGPLSGPHGSCKSCKSKHVPQPGGCECLRGVRHHYHHREQGALVRQGRPLRRHEAEQQEAQWEHRKAFYELSREMGINQCREYEKSTPINLCAVVYVGAWCMCMVYVHGVCAWCRCMVRGV